MTPARRRRPRHRAEASFETFLERAAARVARVLERRLNWRRGPASLVRAMRYAVFGGGKRLRPALVYLGCDTFGGSWKVADGAAAAVELIHTYSLVHDDLPCMDDDKLRRGRPTAHVRFGEAMAILAADALHTEAFATLAEESPREVAPDLVSILARAAGPSGMVGGQVLDLEGEGRPPKVLLVERIHLGKTAALIAASLELGATAAGAGPLDRRRIRAYGEDVGLAFQIADDILDETGDAVTLGKTPGKDTAARKMTFPAAVGLDRAKARAMVLAAKARRRAARLPRTTRALLQTLPTFVTIRTT